MYVYDGCLLIGSRIRFSVIGGPCSIASWVAHCPIGGAQARYLSGGSGRAVEGIAMSLIALKLQ